jgi:hypothetical protein
MELPLTYRDLDLILESIRYKNKDLYAKLWSYKMKHLNKKSE